MGICTRVIGSVWKIKLIDEEVKSFNEAWQDGGTGRIINGWAVVGWAYEVEKGGETVYVEAISDKIPVYDKNGDVPDDYEYDESRIVFLINESPYNNAGGRDWSIFSLAPQVLRKFCLEQGTKLKIHSGVVQQTI